MHIALVNGWPNRPNIAENEYISRFAQAARSIGHWTHEVVTSDDIFLCNPDFVIATHEFTPKLTPHTTLGAMWSPPVFFRDDVTRLRAILSYDGWLIGSDVVRTFLGDLEFSVGVERPKSDFTFLPTAAQTRFVPRPRERPFELAYVGTRWDGLRHGDLLPRLAEANAVTFYGPTERWRDFPLAYRGEIPFDGTSMITTLARHGIALCLHSAEHRDADTPSMRLFEAAAAGSVIICDEIPFARRVLGSNAFYVDLREGTEVSAHRILDHLRRINNDHDASVAMAAASHAILTREYGLQAMIARCCDFARSLAGSGAPPQSEPPDRMRAADPTAVREDAPIDIVLCIRQRSAEGVRNVLASLRRQRAGAYRLLVVDPTDDDAVAEACRRETHPRLPVEYVAAVGTAPRSAQLWAGLDRVEAAWFSIFGECDYLAPDHFESLLLLSSAWPEADLFYSGSVLVDRADAAPVYGANFFGPLGMRVRERRSLGVIHNLNGERPAGDPRAHCRCWMAKRSLLDRRVLTDPGLAAAEETYLFLILAAKARSRCSFRPTAYRLVPPTPDPVEDAALWRQCAERIRRRLPGQDWPPPDHAGCASPAPAFVPTVPPALQDGCSQTFDAGFLARIPHVHLRGARGGGAWTTAVDSSFTLFLDRPADRVRLRMAMRAAPSPGGHGPTVRITINGLSLFSAPVVPDIGFEADGVLDVLPQTDMLLVRIECSHTTCMDFDGPDCGVRPRAGVLVYDVTVTAMPPESGAVEPPAGRLIVEVL